jgi:hypothetical protein
MSVAAVADRRRWRAARLPLVVALTGAVLGALLLALSGGGSASRPIVVSLNGSLLLTLEPGNLTALQHAEQQISALPGVTAVQGPASVIAAAVVQADRQIATQVAQPGNKLAGNPAHHLDQVLVRNGYSAMPSLTDQSFIGQVVFGNGVGPRPALARIFPDSNHARVIVRYGAGVAGSQLSALRRRIAQIIAAAGLTDIQSGVRVGL